MVLNALTSPGMVAASVSILRRGGTFVELGKRDIWSHADIASSRPDVAYHVLAMDFLPADVLQRALHVLTTDLTGGGLQPLPAFSHGVNDTAAGLRQLSQVRSDSVLLRILVLIACPAIRHSCWASCPVPWRWCEDPMPAGEYSNCVLFHNNSHNTLPCHETPNAQHSWPYVLTHNDKDHTNMVVTYSC